MDTPGEAVQISCGPHDLLWVTLWEGQALVREGISRNDPKGGQTHILSCQPRAPSPASRADGGLRALIGAARAFFWGRVGSSWSVVEPPTSENGIMHVSVGVAVVWAVTKDRKVRRGPREWVPGLRFTLGSVWFFRSFGLNP